MRKGVRCCGTRYCLRPSCSVVIHEQLASEGFVVEVVGEAAHRPFEVVALLDDVPGEVFLAIPFAAVAFLAEPSAVR